MDLADRGITEVINEVLREASETCGSQHELMEAMKGLIKEAIEKMENQMDDIASEIKAMVGDLDERLDVVECYVNEQRRKKAHDIGGATTKYKKYLTPTTTKAKTAQSPTPATKKAKKAHGDGDEEMDEEPGEEKDEESG